MKISIELQPCLKNKSGIGIYIYELAKELQRYDDLVMTGDIFNFLNRNPIDKDIEGLVFPMHRCTLFPYGVYRRIWHHLPIRYNALFKEKVEITHFFNFIVPPRIEGKVVNTIHDLTYLLYPDTMDERNLKRITQDIDYSIKRSDKIVAVSHTTKKDLISRLGVASDKIEIIYPGVHADQFSESYTEDEKQRVREKYSLPPHYMLYMGTLEPRKNIESIIEAFALYKKESVQDVKGMKLVLAGKKGWLYESIFERVKRLDLEGEVIFTDYVDEKDKALIYQMAEMFLFPSLYEGFGIPVLEAMAAGIPVITSNVSSLPEVAGEAAILVEPKDIVAIAQGMSRLSSDQAYVETLVERGYEQVKKFTWEASADKLYKLYQSLVEE